MKHLVAVLFFVIGLLSVLLFLSRCDNAALMARRNEITEWYDNELDEDRWRMRKAKQEIQSLKNEINILQHALEQR